MEVRYAHERPDWPAYRWRDAELAPILADLHFRRGSLIAAMAALGFDAERESTFANLVRDVRTSSEIEGEILDVEQIRSSLARRFGLPEAGLASSEREVEGVVEMTLDATQRYDDPLTVDRLLRWHRLLFPYGTSGAKPITVGAWRNGPMYIVSGTVLGQERVVYEAPGPERVPEAMDRLIAWFESASVDPLVRAAVAHLWFETIHPFDDGNGRVGRALIDHALSRADGSSQRFYSLSEQILRHRKDYYDSLERSQKGDHDVTPWVRWFLHRLSDALDAARAAVDLVHRRRAFWRRFGEAGLNERQRRIADLMLAGFQGKMRTEKYAKIAKVSPPTAYRDLADLVEKGVLRPGEGGGRSAHYVLVEM